MGFLQFQLLFLGFFPAFGLGFGCCFRDFCSFSYFFTDFFRMLGWVLGAVLGISAVSATFSQIFPDVGLGFGCCFRDFCSFSYFLTDFSGFWAGFRVLFWGFLRFQLLFPRFFPDFELSLGAVLEVLGITATKIALMKQH